MGHYVGGLVCDGVNEDTDLIKVSHVITVLCHVAVEGQTWKKRRNLEAKNRSIVQ